MKNYLTLVFLLFSLSLISQNDKNKWTVGLSLASAKYSDDYAEILGGGFVYQSPRVNISKYLFKNLTADIGFSTSVLDTQDYTTFDGILRYDFGKSYENVVPYLLLGGSFISAKNLTPTLNFGAGNTFWIFPNYGLNFQVIYKFSETRFNNYGQYSHLYTSVGLVYSFKSRNMNPRLWDMKH